MDQNLPNISESEWLIMNELWRKSPATAAQIVEKIQQEKNLEMTTIKTLLRRLIAKKAVDFTIDPNNSRLYHYFPVVRQEDCILEESKQFLHLYYQGNLKKMFATFLQNTYLSEQEIDNLKNLLDRKRNDIAND